MSRYPSFHCTTGRYEDLDRSRREAQQVQRELNDFETRYQHWSEQARYHWLQRPESRLNHKVKDEMVAAWLYKHRDNLPARTRKHESAFEKHQKSIVRGWRRHTEYPSLEACHTGLFGAWADGWQDAYVDPPEPGLGPRNEALLDAEIVTLDPRKDSVAASSTARRTIKFAGTATHFPDLESNRSESDIPGKTAGESPGESSLRRIRKRITQFVKETLLSWFSAEPGW